jgi:serine protease Do
MRRLFFFFLLLAVACQMPNGNNQSGDMSRWLDIGYNGGDSTNQSSSLTESDDTQTQEPVSSEVIPIGDALKGTYSVIIRTNNGGDLIGSGFLIAPDLLVTNFHVVEDIDFGFVRQNDKSPRYSIDEILKVDAVNDVAILRVKSIQDPFVLPLSGELPKLGDRIYALGCPKGLEGTMSSGIVSQFRERDGKGICKDAESALFYQTDVQINHGSSGGPILNEKGHVIAIAVGGFGDGLNFLVPARFIDVLNKGTF